jgi:hypothetical protein
MVGGGPWYYTKFPSLPKRERDWVPEVSGFYTGMEQAVHHPSRLASLLRSNPTPALPRVLGTACSWSNELPRPG